MQLDTNVFRYKLNVSVDTTLATSLASVIVEYSFVSGTWQRQLEDGSAAAADVTWTTEVPEPGTQTLTLVTPGTSTVTVTLPSTGDAGVPAGFTLDPGTVLNGDPVFFDLDSSRDGVQIYEEAGWIVTLDDTRLPTRNGTTNEYVFGIVVESVGITMRSITFAPALDVQGLGYTGVTASPATQGGSSQNRHNLSTLTNQTFIDVAFFPGAGNTSIDLGSSDTDEFTFGGFGGSGVSVEDERPPGDRPRQRRLPLPAQRLVPAGRGRGRLRRRTRGAGRRRAARRQRRTSGSPRPSWSPAPRASSSGRSRRTATSPRPWSRSRVRASARTS